MERMIVQHLHTNVSGKKPLPSGIMDGELAINYAANDETLFIKNSENAIVEFKDDKYYQKQLSEKADKTLPLTYSELVSLRDNSQLIPGQQYRITDYTCTTTQQVTTSAGHIFDIIVRADSENKLNEEAYAIQHEGDEYFANSDLNAWKLWYCLDNDTTRFAWADETETDGKPNGRGVIYRMIDEFGNDCHYDFKNIQFYRKWDGNEQLWSTISSDNTGVPCYTFSSSGNSATTSFTDYSLASSNNVYSNVIKVYVSNKKQTLNNNCFFGRGCYSNTFGDGCYSNTFGDGCYSNTFGNYCSENTFGNSCDSTFGNDFRYNTFGKNCYGNTFGNDCHVNAFENFFQMNTFGNYCSMNTFGDFSLYNTFGNFFQMNTFGNNCSLNTFGNGCGDNTFGNDCSYNSFGNSCDSNTFGNDCRNNTFGNDCKSIKAGYDYYQYNHFGDGCQYILFKGAETASSKSQVQNYNFAQGLKGTDSVYLTIEGERGRNFETKVEKNSNGNLKIFCLADLIYSEGDNSEPSQPSYPYSTYFIGDI